MKEESGLFEKMKTMPREELESYYDTITTSSFVFNVLGTMLMFSAIVLSDTTWAMCLCLIGTYALAQMAVAVDEAKEYVTKLLEKKI